MKERENIRRELERLGRRIEAAAQNLESPNYSNAGPGSFRAVSVSASRSPGPS